MLRVRSELMPKLATVQKDLSVEDFVSRIGLPDLDPELPRRV
jgi:hypothetical protein